MKILLSVFLFASSLLATQYPVDHDINRLILKANYLKDLKQLFINRTCTAKLNKKTVPISAKALRGEGLVIAAGENFNGWLAYYKAPKPDQLERIVDSTLKGNGSAKDAVIIGSRLRYQGSTPTKLIIFVAEPWLVNGTQPPLWIYQKKGLALDLTNKAAQTKTTKTYLKKNFTLSCSKG